MKIKDFKMLDEAFEAIEMAYECCDTSFTDDENEYLTEVTSWNAEFNGLVEQAKELREQLIYVFQLTDEGEE